MASLSHNLSNNICAWLNNAILNLFPQSKLPKVSSAGYLFDHHLYRKMFLVHLLMAKRLYSESVRFIYYLILYIMEPDKILTLCCEAKLSMALCLIVLDLNIIEKNVTFISHIENKINNNKKVIAWEIERLKKIIKTTHCI